MAHLITGYKGEEHIQSADQGSFNASFFGTGQYVMEAGNQMEASIIDNNTVRIVDGDILMKGRHIRIATNTYEDLTIETGTAGKNRNDLIVMRYEKNNGSGIETAYLAVIKGTETEGTATDPSYTNGDILAGALLNDMPLYRVKIQGVALTEVEQMFSTLTSFGTLAAQYEQEFIDACTSHLESLNILDTKEEILANTQSNQLAGALGVKQIANSKQDASSAITTSNIGSQSVNYATSAGKATKDESGNNIKATYGNSLAVSGQTVTLKNKNGAVLSTITTQDTHVDVVDNLTTSDSRKALSAKQGVTLKNELDGKLSAGGGTVIGALTAQAGLTVGKTGMVTNFVNFAVGGEIRNDTNQQMLISSSSEDDYKVFLGVRSSAWMFSPNKSGKVPLGNASYKWGQIYSTNSTISTSDRNLKKDIELLDEEETKEFIMGLKPVSYKMKDGESGRTHMGFIAQDVEDTLHNMNLSSTDFAGLCKDKEIVDEKETGNYIYGLRYEEFIAPLLKMIQIQQEEIDALKVRIEALEKDN